MRRISLMLVVSSMFVVGMNSHSLADGLIKKLPEPGHWASYKVNTMISQDSKTSSTGVLTVKALGKTTIDEKPCRWVEFEFTWEELDWKEQDFPRARFHSSVTKFAIEEAAFAEYKNPIKGILTGVSTKSSSNELPKQWVYHTPVTLKPRIGSVSGYGMIDQCLRGPFNSPDKLGSKQIWVGQDELKCTGIECSESTHTIGGVNKTVVTTAFRQWSCDKTPFGVVEFEYDKLNFTGFSFRQKLALLDTGKNAESSLPEVK